MKKKNVSIPHKIDNIGYEYISHHNSKKKVAVYFLKQYNCFSLTYFRSHPNFILACLEEW